MNPVHLSWAVALSSEPFWGKRREKSTASCALYDVHSLRRCGTWVRVGYVPNGIVRLFLERRAETYSDVVMIIDPVRLRIPPERNRTWVSCFEPRKFGGKNDNARWFASADVTASEFIHAMRC